MRQYHRQMELPLQALNVPGNPVIADCTAGQNGPIGQRREIEDIPIERPRH